MNILFLGKRSNNLASGVEKKIQGEIESLKKLGHKVYYICTKRNQICLVDYAGHEEVIVQYKENRISIYWAYERAVVKLIQRQGADFQLCYVRKILVTPMHIRALSAIKKANIRIVEEIPTYPYDLELKKSKGIDSKIYLLIDILFRKKLKKYVEKIVTFSDDDVIFGISTIKINNGIDVDLIPLKGITTESNVIRLVTVSNMNFWHGYDRLIRGIYEYYKEKKGNKDIYLNMVGGGPLRSEWEHLVKDLKMEENIRFWGELEGKELDEIFTNSDIAVSSLGFHRLNLTKVSPLKTREYVARGIPVIYAGRDETLEPNLKFCLEVQEGEEKIDIIKIICFCEKLAEMGDVRINLREYAEENFTWYKQMEYVLKKLGEE